MTAIEGFRLRVTDDHAGPAGPVRVLIVDLDPRGSTLVETMLRVTRAQGLVTTRADSLADAARELRAHGTSCVLLSVGGASDAESLAYVHSCSPQVPIVVITDRPDEELALRALQIGAQDYLVQSEINPTLLGRAVSNAIERNRSGVRLSNEALHDPLTGLPNRALFLDRLALAVERSHRTGTPLAVLFLDVDGFKGINDSLGHASGDRVLEHLADRLSAVLRPMDTVARFGGDEFTFLLEGLASEREALLIAERINGSIGLPIRLEDRDVSVTVSIGIAMAGGPGIAAEVVIGEADAAMYRAKSRGPARYELFDESSRRRGMERIELEAALRNAVERSELRVHYQPKVSLNGSWEVVGFEALVRWEHPTRGLIAPSEFLPAAEATGLMAPIGEYVVEQALRELTRWRATRPDATLSVNLSARELREAGLAASLQRAIDASGNDPRALCLDIAESTVMHESDIARQVLRRLKATGVRLAIDDYGTGYSSLLALKRLPIDVIKIHESFVHDLGISPDQASLVQAIVHLARALGLDTVAEGVETNAQLEQLRRLGCDGAQGFLFGRPVPPLEAEALLTRP